MIPARAPPSGWKKGGGKGSWGNKKEESWSSSDDSWGSSDQSWGSKSDQSWESKQSWGNDSWSNKPKTVPPKVVTPGGSPYASGKTVPAVQTGWAKKEEEAKKRQEDLKNRREKEEQKRAQQQAALVVKKVIQRLRVVGPDKFSAVVEELEKVQAEQAEAMGELVEEVNVEAQKALEIAEKRFKVAEEKKAAEAKRKEEEAKKAEEKKAEEERKAAEEKERLEGLIAEVESEFEEALKSVEAVEVAAKTFTEEGDKASPSLILDAAQATQEAVDAAKPILDKALTSLKEKRNEVTKTKIPKEEFISKLSDFHKKLIASQKSIVALKDAGKAASQKATKKASAMKREQDQKDAFASADKDGDGILGIKEAVAFANSEYGFALEGATKDKILGRLSKKEGGVPYELFQQFRAMITIEKSIIAAREKRKQQELLEKAREEKKAAITSKIEPITKALEEAEAALQSAKKAARFFAPGAKQDLTSSEIFEAISDSQQQVDTCQARLDFGEESLKGIANAEEDAADAVLGKFRKTETEKLQAKSKSTKTTLSKIVAQLREAKDKAMKKQYSEMEKLRLLVAPCVMGLLTGETKTSEALFTSAGGKDEGMSKEDFVALVKSLSEKLPAELVPEPLQKDKVDEMPVETLFSHVADEKDTVSQERFSMLMTRQYYRVSKPTGLSETVTIDSKAVRKLELGETLEALEAPTMEGDSKLARVKCRSLKDDKEGWVTLAGNKGSVFLEGVPHYITCTKETPLTDDLAVLSSKTVRKTQKGEHFQVLEFDKKDSSVNLMRMKVLAMRDKVIGYVTAASSEGAKFFEPC